MAGRAADLVVSNASQISAALISANPGDNLVMATGNWMNADVLFNGNGTADRPITLRAQVPGQVFLTGTSRLRIAGSYLVVDGLTFRQGYRTSGDVIAFRDTASSLATNCRVSNCAIIDYNPPTSGNDTKWVSLYGISNRVENCFLKGKQNAGTTLVVWLAAGQTNLSNHHVIRRNYFGPRPDLGENGGETIRVGDSATSFTTSRTLVEENFFEACSGEIEIISNKSCDNIYRYNTFDSCEGALTFRHGNRCTAEGNWFFGRGLPQTGGVRIIGEDHRVFNNYFDGLTGSSARSALTMMDGVVNSPLNGYFQVKRAVVGFNTFVGCVNNFLIGQPDGGGTLAPIDCIIANNIVRSSNRPLVRIVTAPTNFLWQGNLFSGAAVGIANPGIATNNPLLILSSNSVWRPATNSPALGSAVGDYPFVADDIEGQNRSGAKDVGCDEHSLAPTLRRPLTPLDVGPDWMNPRPRLQSASFSERGFTMQWNAPAGAHYQVQYSDDLPVWMDLLPTIVSSNSLQSWTDDGTQIPNPPATGFRSYRLRQLP